MKNGLARGVRQASDFLMALQLTGAARTNSVANLQLRMPIVVIGGGLTAIDTATESLAYYVVQVEKFLERYETLSSEKSESEVRATWSAEETETADEFISHGRAIRAEREKAAHQGRDPNLVALLNTFGGVTIAYRRRLIDAPSYTLNHEEVEKALEEGVLFAEELTKTMLESGLLKEETDRYVLTGPLPAMAVPNLRPPLRPPRQERSPAARNAEPRSARRVRRTRRKLNLVFRELRRSSSASWFAFTQKSLAAGIGHQRTCTFATMYFFGTNPQRRLSELLLRWSPITKKYPGGTGSGPQSS